MKENGATRVPISAIADAACLPLLVTVTVTAPAPCAGVVAVIVVAFTTVTPVPAVPPTLTVAPVAKPVPVIVIVVAPAVEPDAGATLVTVGAGARTVSGKVVVWTVAPAVAAGLRHTQQVDSEVARLRDLRPSLIVRHADTFPAEFWWRPFHRPPFDLPSVALGWTSAGDIATRLGRRGPGVSHHLALLLAEGLVHCRHDGPHRVYSLDAASTLAAWNAYLAESMAEATPGARA